MALDGSGVPALRCPVCPKSTGSGDPHPVGELLVRAGAQPAPLEVSIDPYAPLDFAALHPVARTARAS
ncbi:MULTISPECIES: hypothetical protein [Streptomyces]|uniref:hypothetical protein n=1 Tax=Streptomyces TaxID=1883 RepID=UPI0036106C8C